ncbi:peptidase M23 [Fusobacterium necrophorum]|uniref:Peptidase M23 n=1 Tax=Fusobacterium necrophorum TaxID=859 RepID=A0A4Q2KVX2_9FUSO|nr:peptidoglycan DD-metalloendopeptidase family protein [Fusobacterium necrophorum]RXZ68690.1 peptidase M23 [Fusobacterium necrophorum]
MKGRIFFLVFLCLFQFSFSDQVKDMKKKIQNIEKQIQVKNTRIKKIDVEKSQIEKQIEQLKREIEENTRKRLEMQDEIVEVSKKIAYGTKNLEVSKQEFESKKLQYDAKMIAWSHYLIGHAGDLEDKPLVKKDFKTLLHSDLRRMGKIQTVQGDIQTVKEQIEAERAKLAKLQAGLAANIAEGDRKQKQQNALIAQLNQEKKQHQGSIQKLSKEKARIARQIEQIIRSRTKVDTKIVKKTQAYSKIGKTIKPLDGPIVVHYGQMKSGQVSSNGIEIKAKMGAAVKAATSGTVIYASTFQGLGKVIMIDYGYNTIGVYGNLISLKASVNQKVSKGQVIGILGVSSNGEPHLYYELRFNLKPVDPMGTF